MSNMKTIHLSAGEVIRERILEDENRLMYSVHVKIGYKNLKTGKRQHRWKQTTFIVVHFKDDHVVAWSKQAGKAKNHHRVVRRAFAGSIYMTPGFKHEIGSKALNKGMTGDVDHLFFPALKDLYVEGYTQIPYCFDFYLARPNPTPASFAKWLTGSSRIGKGTAKRLFNTLKETFKECGTTKRDVLSTIRRYKIRDNDKINALLDANIDIMGMMTYYTRIDFNLIRVLLEDKPITWATKGDEVFFRDTARMISRLLPRDANREPLKGYKNLRTFVRGLNLPDSLERAHDQLMEQEASIEASEYDVPLPINKYLEVLNGYTHMGHKIVLPTNGKELYKVGSRLKNCVAGYTHGVSIGRTNIAYVVNQDDKPIYCIEIGTTDGFGFLEILQFSGRFNKNLENSDSIGCHLREYIETRLKEANIQIGKHSAKEITAPQYAPQPVPLAQGVEEFEFDE